MKERLGASLENQRLISFWLLKNWKIKKRFIDCSILYSEFFDCSAANKKYKADGFPMMTFVEQFSSRLSTAKFR
jgi:hypothetical protein